MFISHITTPHFHVKSANSLIRITFPSVYDMNSENNVGSRPDEQVNRLSALSIELNTMHPGHARQVTKGTRTEQEYYP